MNDSMLSRNKFVFLYCAWCLGRSELTIYHETMGSCGNPNIHLFYKEVSGSYQNVTVKLPELLNESNMQVSFASPLYFQGKYVLLICVLLYFFVPRGLCSFKCISLLLGMMLPVCKLSNCFFYYLYLSFTGRVIM